MLQSMGPQRFRHDIVTEQQQMGFSYEEMSYLKEQDANNSESESHSVVSDSVIPWTVACQAPLSMVFSRQEYWNGLPFSSPGDLPDPDIEPRD